MQVFQWSLHTKDGGPKHSACHTQKENFGHQFVKAKAFEINRAMEEGRDSSVQKNHLAQASKGPLAVTDALFSTSDEDKE